MKTTKEWNTINEVFITNLQDLHDYIERAILATYRKGRVLRSLNTQNTFLDDLSNAIYKLKKR